MFSIFKKTLVQENLRMLLQNEAEFLFVLNMVAETLQMEGRRLDLYDDAMQDVKHEGLCTLALVVFCLQGLCYSAVVQNLLLHFEVI